MPEPRPTMPPPTSIIRTRLARILRSRGRINRRVDRRLTRPLTPTPITPTTTTAHTTPSSIVIHTPLLLLLLVLLLLERELVLGRVRRTRRTLHAWIAAAHGHHLLLHGHWVHAAAWSAASTLHSHHLLHRHRVHAVALLGCDVLLHLLEVLLHALPVLRHHGGRHAVVGSACRTAHSASHALIETTATASIITVPKLVPPTAPTAELLVSALVVAHVAAWLCALDFDGLTEDLEGLAQRGVDSRVTVESNEAEAAGTAGLFVHHEGCVYNAAELLEEFGKVFFGGFLGDAADEDLGCALLFFARDGALGVDLGGR